MNIWFLLNKNVLTLINWCLAVVLYHDMVRSTHAEYDARYWQLCLYHDVVCPPMQSMTHDIGSRAYIVVWCVHPFRAWRMILAVVLNHDMVQSTHAGPDTQYWQSCYIMICERIIEKRAHFAQNARIGQFSTYRNLKTPRALDFRLGL